MKVTISKNISKKNIDYANKKFEIVLKILLEIREKTFNNDKEIFNMAVSAQMNLEMGKDIININPK